MWLERKVEGGGCESAQLLPAQTFHLLQAKPSHASEVRVLIGCSRLSLNEEYGTRSMGWRPLSSDTSDPATQRLTLTHTQGARGSLGRLGKYAAHPLTGAQHIGRAFWAAMGGRALVGSGWGGGGTQQTCVLEETPGTKLIHNAVSFFLS